MRLTDPLKNPDQAYADRMRYSHILSDERWEYNGSNYRLVRFPDWTFELKDGEFSEAYPTIPRDVYEP